MILSVIKQQGRVESMASHDFCNIEVCNFAPPPHSRLHAIPETIPQTPGKPERMTSSIESIPYDVLELVLRALKRLARDPYLLDSDGEQRKQVLLGHHLGALSMTSKYFRDLCLPSLYEELSMRGHASHVARRFSEVRNLSKAEQQYIKSAHIFFTNSEPNASLIMEQVALFRHLKDLGKLDRLEKLEIYFGQDNDDLVILDLIDVDVRKKLRRVHTLKMIPFCPSILIMCPNVVSLSAHYPRSAQENMMSTTFRVYSSFCWGEFSKLRNISINAMAHYSLLSDLVEIAPNLENLNVTSGGKIPWRGESAHKWCPKYTESLVITLPGFRNLQHLRVFHEGPTAVKKSGGAVNDNPTPFIRSIGAACANLRTITFRDNWKAGILRGHDGDGVEFFWLEQRKGKEMFSDRRTTDLPSPAMLDTGSNGASHSQTIEQVWFWASLLLYLFSCFL